MRHLTHYPCEIAGTKVSFSINEVEFGAAIIVIKVPHRKGQLVNIELVDNDYRLCSIAIEDSPKYTRIICRADAYNFLSLNEAIRYCKAQISGIHKYVNFDAKMDLVTKELLNILS